MKDYVGAVDTTIPITLIRSRFYFNISVDKLLHFVAQHFGYHRFDVLSSAQLREYKVPRSHISRIISSFVRITYKQIGSSTQH